MNMVLLLHMSTTRLLTPPKMSFQFIYVLGKTIHGEINANLMPILYCTAICSYYCLLQAGKNDFFMKISWQEKVLIKCR